jgi:rhodanese-related sulfurtransferase
MGAALLMTLALLTACAAPATDQMAANTAETQAAQATATETSDEAEDVQVITAQKAKQIMDNEQGATIVDVREPDEFSEGHIAGAKLLPLGSLKKLAATELPDLDATILVYCRSGARSSMGAQVLASMGYTHVLDMGGVISWPYGLVR